MVAEPGADPDDAAFAEAAAKRLCAACPSLARCAERVDALPRSKRPPGVVAGTVHRPKPVGRPTKRPEGKTHGTHH